MSTLIRTRFNVGGVLLDRPFKVRRLGHVGLYLDRVGDSLPFYKDLLGFRISDFIWPGREITECPADYAEINQARGCFMSYGTDHHSLVLFHPRPGSPKPTTSVQQVTWQVGSLAEVVNGTDWFNQHSLDFQRAGRDMPGSNWHCYLMDPEKNQNEIYYGMEQIGWTGQSKPAYFHRRKFDKAAPLPQISEYTEIETGLTDQVDMRIGYRDRERLPLDHEVEGVMMARPFKIVRLGPVHLFTEDMGKSEEWYREVMGLVVTEEVTWQGHRCVFLRGNTEHHALALYPMALRASLGLRADTTLMSAGVQLASYGQLRAAKTFLESHGVRLRELPPELSPGMEHSFLAFDPEGNAIQLYWSMEQVGWDGKPRPAGQRRKVVPGHWPDAVEATADSFAGEPFLGPWR